MDRVITGRMKEERDNGIFIHQADEIEKCD